MRMSNWIVPSMVAGVTFVAATASQAQHSYLPAQNNAGKIVPLVDSGSGNEPDYVVTNSFTTALAGNVYRAGAPSAFAANEGDAAFPPGFSALFPNTDLTISNPVLSNPSLGASGNLLYWDGTGDVNFGAVPANTTVTILRLESDGTLTFKATLDGSASPVGPWVEDTTNATAGRSGHFHLQYDVVGDDTSAANEAPDGVYLLGHIAGMSGLEDSNTVFVPLLKNAALDPDLVTAFGNAVQFVEANLVPEPTVGVLLAVGGGLALVGRKRANA